jgi:hypothetical protein
MPAEAPERVEAWFRRMSRDDLAATKQLFCSELKDDRAGATLPSRNAPLRTANALDSDTPLLTAQASQSGSLAAVHGRLSPGCSGSDRPLSPSVALPATNPLLNNLAVSHPVSSDLSQRPGHQANVLCAAVGRQGTAIARRHQFSAPPRAHATGRAPPPSNKSLPGRKGIQVARFPRLEAPGRQAQDFRECPSNKERRTRKC